MVVMMKQTGELASHEMRTRGHGVPCHWQTVLFQDLQSVLSGSRVECSPIPRIGAAFPHLPVSSMALAPYCCCLVDAGLPGSAFTGEG
jgi:hypothetical protein